jgi:uncharacterized phosphosugar-binding protein
VIGVIKSEVGVLGDDLGRGVSDQVVVSVDVVEKLGIDSAGHGADAPSGVWHFARIHDMTIQMQQRASQLTASPATTEVAPAEGAAQRWIREARGVLDRVASQQHVIDQVCELCAEAIAGGGLVHLFGTGHSRIPLEEMFPRYGSYPGWHPIAELSMTFHTQVVGTNGQRQAMFIERVPGLAEQILTNFTLTPPDVMMVFSASGRSAVPIEMAIGARRRGLKVIAVTSVAQTHASPPTHETNTRLLDHADLVLDLGTPAADAMVFIHGLAEPVGPGSTIANVAFVNAIKAGTAERLVALEAMPPVITSESVVGKARSAALFDGAYLEYARRIANTLRTA